MTGMKRSKSSDLPRPDGLLRRSRSGEWRQDRAHTAAGGSRSSAILDDDARKMLRDCQEYLLGAYEAGDEEPEAQQRQRLAGRFC